MHLKRKDNIKWIVLAVFLLIPFVSFCYQDTKSIIHYQINFADALFSGRILDFYDICYERALGYDAMGLSGSHVATYDIVMHALLGIWGIPLYFWCALKGVPEILYNTSCVLFGKAIYIPALIISAYFIYKICIELRMDEEHSEWASYLFCSSLLVFTNVCIIGQSDILAIPFVLTGLLYYIREDNKKFLAFFMVAIAFKMFAFFIFVPLLLLREKRVIRIILSIIAVYSLSFVANLPYSLKTTPGVLEKAKFNQVMLSMLLEQRIPLLDGNVSLLIVALGILCLYCYLKPLNYAKEMKISAIYIALLSMGIVFLCFFGTPYWYLHLAPYLAIVIAYYSDKWNYLILFETVGMVILTIENYVKFPWCYDLANANDMLMQKIFGLVKVHPITLEQLTWHLKSYQDILNAAFVVCIIAIVWLARTHKIELLEKTEANALFKCAYIRLAVNVAVAYLPMLLYISNTKPF